MKTRETISIDDMLAYQEAVNGKVVEPEKSTSLDVKSEVENQSVLVKDILLYMGREPVITKIH